MIPTKRYEKRVLVSFRGRCPMHCKHCYTYDLEQREEKTIPEIVAETGKEAFDIIYLSQKYENFYDGEQGLALCYELYAKYQKDIFIITRSYIGNEIMERLGRLNQEMQQHDNQLYIAVSLCADQSYTITEDPTMCPTPSKRLENLSRGRAYGMRTLLVLRPVFPNAVVPVDEYVGILEQAKGFVDAVISSGLIITDSILARLGLGKDNFVYLEKGDSDYLSDLEEAQYLDVEGELFQIQEGCQSKGISFFRHSMPALNYLATLI